MAPPSQITTGKWGTVQRLTWEQDRHDERSYWAGKTVSERLAAMVELNKRAFLLNDAEAYDGSTTRFVRRTPRR